MSETDTIGTGPQLDVCGTCAVMIANDDTSGDDDGGEARRAALSSVLTEQGGTWPVVACAGVDDCRHPWTSGPCDVCGDPDGWGELHRVVTDPV